MYDDLPVLESILDGLDADTIPEFFSEIKAMSDAWTKNRERFLLDLENQNCSIIVNTPTRTTTIFGCNYEAESDSDLETEDYEE